MMIIITITVEVDRVDIDRAASKETQKTNAQFVRGGPVRLYFVAVRDATITTEEATLEGATNSSITTITLHSPERGVRKAKPRQTIIKPGSNIQTRNRSKYSSSTLILNLIIKPLLFFSGGFGWFIFKKFLLYHTPLTGVSAVDAELIFPRWI